MTISRTPPPATRKGLEESIVDRKRNERLDVLLGERGTGQKPDRAVRIGELDNLVAKILAKIQSQNPDPPVVTSNVGDPIPLTGRWTRLSDGSQFCRITLTFPGAISTAFQSGYRSAYQRWVYPMPFAATPQVIAVASNGSAFGAVTALRGRITVSVAATAPASQASATRVIDVLAYGRYL